MVDSTRARDERGASAVEYGLLVAGIAVVILSAVFLFGNRASDMFANNCNSLASQMNGSTSCSP